MDTTATIAPEMVIGQTCDFGGCSAPYRIVATFTSGELSMCHHHWRRTEDAIVVLPAFVRVLLVEDRVPAGV